MYWNSPLLKENAKKVLAGSYWRVFVVCLVASLLGGNSDLSSKFSGFLSGINSSLSFGSFGADVSSILLVGSIVLLVGAAGIAFSLFISIPVLIGTNRYMMENRSGFPPFSSLFSVFNDKQQYLNVVKVMFQYSLEIFLWSLLCFIPGIYKSYQYYYVPYLLAENPYMSYSRAKQLSIAMTNDEKIEIWVLEISFFGWLVLGSLACGLGVFFVVPYMNATFAELYAAARAKAFALGVTDETELAGFTQYDSGNSFI